MVGYNTGRKQRHYALRQRVLSFSAAMVAAISRSVHTRADHDGWGTATVARSASRERRAAGLQPGPRLRPVLVWLDTAHPVSAGGEITRDAGAIAGADEAQRRTGDRTGAHTHRARYSRCPFALAGRP